MDNSKAILIIGAGAAGMAAAISAASMGANVFLIEKTTHMGGTVAHSLIHTIGGLYDSSGEFINGGLPVELADRLSLASSLTHKRKIGRTWTLTVSPAVYQRVVEGWIGDESRIEVFCESEIKHIVKEKDLIREIEVVTAEGKINFKPKALIDATGNAEVIRMIDPDLVIDNPRRAAGGLIFQMRGVKPQALKFPKGVELVRTIRRAAQDGTLPRECAMAWIDTGLYEDEAYGKLAVSLGGNWREPEVLAESIRNAVKIRDELVAFLGRLPDFSTAKIIRTGRLGIRDGGLIKGEYCLTEADVKNGSRFPDAVCRCCWPIEYWDPETGVSLEYLRPDDFYEIPLRALKVRNVRNLWAVGKCLSAEPLAQASARIAGSCWAMGEGVGKAAVQRS